MCESETRKDGLDHANDLIDLITPSECIGFHSSEMLHKPHVAPNPKSSLRCIYLQDLSLAAFAHEMYRPESETEEDSDYESPQRTNAGLWVEAELRGNLGRSALLSKTLSQTF